MLRLILIVALMQCATFVADAEAQSCNPAVTHVALDNRYRMQANSTEVLDTQTGLIWQRCSLGQKWNGMTCVVSTGGYTWNGAGMYTWQEAMEAARDVGNDWRLPNVKELQSLVEEACYNPTINIKWFPGTVSNGYWTSSPYVAKYAKMVNFDYGNSNYFSNDGILYVRLVRSSIRSP